MQCPHCSFFENHVLDTRLQKESVIRRRRECLNCKSRFTTIETLLVHYPHVVKKDGRREPFNKEKLRRGIQIACKKRPVSITQIEGVVGNISKWAQHRGEKEVPSSSIGQMVVSELKKMDDVAYVRFASVYRTFRDVNEFVESLAGESKL